MAEQAGDPGTPAPAATGNATATVQTPAAPSFSVPQGFKDFDEVVKYANLGRGSSAYYTKGAEHGIKSPSDFDTYAPLFKAMKGRNITPEFAARVFANDPATERQETDGTQRAPAGFDPQAVERTVDEKVEYRFAKRDHDSAEKAEPELSLKVAKATLGKDASDFEVKRFARELRAETKREPYPGDHPLHKDFWSPFSEELLGKTAAALKKEMDDFKAQSIANKADEYAGKSSASSVAGNPGNQGAPKQQQGRESKDDLIRRGITEARQKVGQRS